MRCACSTGPAARRPHQLQPDPLHASSNPLPAAHRAAGQLRWFLAKTRTQRPVLRVHMSPTLDDSSNPEPVARPSFFLGQSINPGLDPPCLPPPGSGSSLVESPSEPVEATVVSAVVPMVAEPSPSSDSCEQPTAATAINATRCVTKFRFVVDRIVRLVIVIAVLTKSFRTAAVMVRRSHRRSRCRGDEARRHRGSRTRTDRFSESPRL
jgi:hypothetical protein